MRGVINHVFKPKISTDCTTTLKNTPKTLGLAPSCPRILVSWAKISHAFFRLPTNAGQFSSATVKTRHRYLKEITVLSGLL